MKQHTLCPLCGTELPEAAAFCPRCARSINDRTALAPPRPSAGRRVLRTAIPLLLLCVLALGGWSLYARSRIHDSGGPELYYRDEDREYRIVTGWRNAPLEGAWEVHQPVALGDRLYTFPLCAYVYDSKSGVAMQEEFMEKVARYSTEIRQPAGSASPWYTDNTGPQPNYVPHTMLVTSVHFTANSSPQAELVWTLEMKNGDILRVRNKLFCEPYPVYDYYPEDTPMSTTEELQALVDEINGRAEEGYAQYNIHLPAVTYGGLDMLVQTINLYGSTEGEKRTTFTGPVHLSPWNNSVTFFDNIDFQGSGSGTGVLADIRLFLTNCGITGWETGVTASGSNSWVAIQDCLVEGNGTGFYLDAKSISVTTDKFTNNRFLNNGTAVLLDSSPVDYVLDFSGCLFDGNGTDIDNRCGQKVDISEAIFE